MGRSVMTLSDATVIAYNNLEPDEAYYREQYDEDMNEGLIDEDEDFDDYMWSRYNDTSAEEFQDYIDGIVGRAKELWPSFEECDRWIGNEVHVIAENSHSIITISEYCGLVSICLGANYDRSDYWRDPSELSGLGESWRKKISTRFEETFGELRKIGTASNGESFFEKA